MTEKEFFEGYSVPRNKELMRVFRDLDLVEHLGSGIPRILRAYGKDCSRFTENFLRMTFPAWEKVPPPSHPPSYHASLGLDSSTGGRNE